MENDAKSIAPEELGVKEQKNISNLSDVIFNAVASEDDGIVNLIKDMMSFLERLEDVSKKKKKGFFASKSSEQELVSYRDAERRIDHVSEKLKDYQLELIKKSGMLERYEIMNREYLKKLESLIQTAITRRDSLDPDDFMQKQDIDTLVSRIENMQTTVSVSHQLSQQIHMMSTNNKILTAKIQDILTNTIAVWKNQVVIRLERSKGLAELNEQNRKLIEKLNTLITN